MEKDTLQFSVDLKACREAQLVGDIIIGVNSFTHDTSVVVLNTSGEILLALEEERLSRIKNQPGFVYGCGAPVHSLEIVFRMFSTSNITSLSHSKSIDYSASKYNVPQRNFLKWSQSLKDRADKTDFYEHHLCHAASSFYPSGFSEAYVCTLDAQGDGVSMTISVARGCEIQRIFSLPGYRSVCSIYSYIAELLGLGRRAEGSLMALADFGDQEIDTRPIFYVHGFCVSINEDSVRWIKEACSKELSFTQRANIAKHVQDHFVGVILEIIHKISTDLDVKNLALSGGGFLNCKLVQKISETGRWSNVYTNPAMGDSGTALGAAILSMADPREVCFTSPFLGMRSPGDIENIGSKASASKISALLASGKIGAIFEGRDEFGARALGNRSILADPRNASSKDRLNEIKNRQKWRPVAPCILHDEGEHWFSNYVYSPYMTRSFSVLPKRSQLIPAVIHVDGSARIQSITQENGLIYQVLKDFFKKTGVPILCNTSFNIQEPIVNHFNDAVRILMETSLDFIVTNEMIISKDDL